MNRGELTTIQWERLQPLLPPQKPKTGRPAHDHRTLSNGLVWMLRTGAPWRDLPARYGPWRPVASRFSRWPQADVWSQLLAAVQAQADAQGQRHGDVHVIDGTMLRAHQHAAGATKGTQRPKPSAAAGVGAVPKSTGEPKGVASS
jgi:transposase